LITKETITQAVKELCLQANINVRKDVTAFLKQAKEIETQDNACFALDVLIKNAEIAADEQKPFCQDTGYVTVFFEWGAKVALIDDLQKAVDEGVKLAYKEGYFRQSIVSDPLFKRENTGDNTPGLINFEIVSGSEVKVSILIKGAGSDNASNLVMLNPTVGTKGVEEAVLELVKQKGARSCPPLLIAVAVGGSFDKAGQASKKLLFRKIGERNDNPKIAQMELDLLDKINKLGIGPGGLGGRATAMDVFINQKPCHMATMPVAINICCHAVRTAEAVLR